MYDTRFLCEDLKLGTEAMYRQASAYLQEKLLGAPAVGFHAKNFQGFLAV